MHCPLCQNKNNQKELFKTLNAFTSTVKFDTKQFINNLDDSNSSCGGGYCKGNNIITLVQCQNCGYVFNSTFDLNKISQEYQNKTYLSRKIVSKAMNNTTKLIKENLLKYIDKNSTCLEIAPGSGDMVNALIHDIKFMYTIDPSLISLEMENINNL
ncbi:SAM-dependent methyltransferase, partial [Campylobacter jejuni]|nr:SAM-dependent methyltransferase [Campylobacter jejuni]